MTPLRAFHDPAAPTGRGELRKALEAGQAVALATETVPGLAVLAGRPGAAERLAELKQSGPGRPFTLHLSGPAQLRRLLPAPPPGLAAWLAARTPGPLTVVVPRDWTALPGDWEWPWKTVALRVPDHASYRALAGDLPAPLLMTSINPAGKEPLRGSALAAWLGARPGIVLGFDPRRVRVGTPSPVVAFEPLPRQLRGRLASGDLRPGMRVLVLCTGNICRSPLASALLEQELASAWGLPRADLQETGWVIASAGTFAMPGAPASEHSAAAAAERGLDLSAHAARLLDHVLRLRWDLVLGMTARHLKGLPRRMPAELFDPRGTEVGDPFGGSLRLYRQVAEQLERAARLRVEAWSRWPQENA